MTPDHYLILAALLFGIGLVGAVSRRNLFVVYMSIELMLSSVNLVLATFSRIQGDHDGSVMALIMIAVIASEAAVFLAMIIALFRSKRTIGSQEFNTLAQRREP